MTDKEPETLSEAIVSGLNSGAREFIAPTVFICRFVAKPFVAMFQYVRDKIAG